MADLTLRSGAKKQASVDRLHEKTFRGWVNKYLRYKKPPVQLDALFTGFHSGVQLLALVELLTRKAVKQRTYAKPSMEIHKIENVSIALAHLRDKTAGDFDVEPVDIVAGKPKVILGLVWRLVLRFQNFGDGADLANIGMNKGEITMEAAKAKSLAWWQANQDVPVESISGSFSDGRAILDLIAKVVPDKAEAIAAQVAAQVAEGDDKARLALALTLADEHLGVLPLLDAEDVWNVDPALRPDEQCILTYVSEFPAAVKAIAENVDQEKEFASAVDKLRAEHAAQEAAAAAEMEQLRSEQAELATQREAELAELARQREAKLAELETATAAEREAALAELRAEAEAAAAAHAEAVADLAERTKAKEEELLARQVELAATAEAEKAAVEKEREAARAADVEERAELEVRKREEIARLRAEAAERLRRKQDELERQREEDANRAKMSAEQFEAWKARQLAELARANAEREALEQVSFEELRRLREENERLRRGTPHTFDKKKRFGMGASCGLCKSSLFGQLALQCKVCQYILCTKCMRRAPPNNCIAGGGDAASTGAFDEALIGVNPDFGEVIMESLKTLVIQPPFVAVEKELAEEEQGAPTPTTPRAPVSSGWKKNRRVSLVQGGMLAYYSDNSKLKGLVALGECTFVEHGPSPSASRKGLDDGEAWGLQDASEPQKVMWFWASKEEDRESWRRALKRELANAKAAHKPQTLVLSGNRVVVRLYDAVDRNTSWTLALEHNAVADHALTAWARKTGNPADQYDLVERAAATLQDRRINPTQPLVDLMTIREAAGSGFSFVVKLKV